MTRLFSLAPLTAIELTPPELVDAAARTGYDGVSFRLSPFRAGEPQHQMFDNSPMLLETEWRLRDTGLKVIDIEVLFLTAERNIREFERVFQTAARLGARNALTLIDIADRQLAVDKFASLCELAAGFGIACSLEFAAWLGIGSIAAAHEVVQAAKQANSGILLDPFHLARSGGLISDISAISRDQLRYAQFCDAPAVAPATTAAISEEARYERLLPGEGQLPLEEFVRAIPADVPLALEVPNRTLAAQIDLDERLKRTLSAAKCVVQRAT